MTQKDLINQLKYEQNQQNYCFQEINRNLNNILKLETVESVLLVENCFIKWNHLEQSLKLSLSEKLPDIIPTSLQVIYNTLKHLYDHEDKSSDFEFILVNCRLLNALTSVKKLTISHSAQDKINQLFKIAERYYKVFKKKDQKQLDLSMLTLSSVLTQFQMDNLELIHTSRYSSVLYLNQSCQVHESIVIQNLPAMAYYASNAFSYSVLDFILLSVRQMDKVFQPQIGLLLLKVLQRFDIKKLPSLDIFVDVLYQLDYFTDASFKFQMELLSLMDHFHLLATSNHLYFKLIYLHIKIYNSIDEKQLQIQLSQLVDSVDQSSNISKSGNEVICQDRIVFLPKIYNIALQHGTSGNILYENDQPYIVWNQKMGLLDIILILFDNISQGLNISSEVQNLLQCFTKIIQIMVQNNFIDLQQGFIDKIMHVYQIIVSQCGKYRSLVQELTTLISFIQINFYENQWSSRTQIMFSKQNLDLILGNLKEFELYKISGCILQMASEIFFQTKMQCIISNSNQVSMDMDKVFALINVTEFTLNLVSLTNSDKIIKYSENLQYINDYLLLATSDFSCLRANQTGQAVTPMHQFGQIQQKLLTQTLFDYLIEVVDSHRVLPIQQDDSLFKSILLSLTWGRNYLSACSLNMLKIVVRESQLKKLLYASQSFQNNQFLLNLYQIIAVILNSQSFDIQISPKFGTEIYSHLISEFEEKSHKGILTSICYCLMADKLKFYYESETSERIALECVKILSGFNSYHQSDLFLLISLLSLVNYLFQRLPVNLQQKLQDQIQVVTDSLLQQLQSSLNDNLDCNSLIHCLGKIFKFICQAQKKSLSLPLIKIVDNPIIWSILEYEIDESVDQLISDLRSDKSLDLGWFQRVSWQQVVQPCLEYGPKYCYDSQPLAEADLTVSQVVDSINHQLSDRSSRQYCLEQWSKVLLSLSLSKNFKAAHLFEKVEILKSSKILKLAACEETSKYLWQFCVQNLKRTDSISKDIQTEDINQLIDQLIET